MNDLVADLKGRRERDSTLATENPPSSLLYLGYVVVLQGNVEVGALLFSGLLCAVVHLAVSEKQKEQVGIGADENQDEIK